MGEGIGISIPWATRYTAQLELQGIGRAIKEFVVCLQCDQEL